MKKNYWLFFFAVMSFSAFGQENSSLKLGTHVSLDANIGYDLLDVIKTSIRDENSFTETEEPGRFNYGFHFQYGIQPFNRFSLAAGIRYSYVTPYYHILYATGQANVYIGNIDQDEFSFVFARGGKMFNRSAVSEAQFFGVGYTNVQPISKNFGQTFQVYLEGQHIDKSTLFIGFSYGIILFNRKN